MSSPDPLPLSPRVTRLSVTPIKGLALHHPGQVELDASGAVGDRDFFLVDEQRRLLSITRTGVFATWRASFDRHAGVLRLDAADGRQLEAPVVRGEPLVATFSSSRSVPGHLVDGPWSDWLSDIAGQPVSLVRTKVPGEGFDSYPVTLLSHASVAELGSHTPTGSLDARRFRMLIELSGVTAYEEESWRGRALSVGSAQLRVGGPVPRCNATTRDPDSGDSDLRTLHLIHEQRGRQLSEFGDGLNLGVFAEVVTPGTVSVGDELHLGQ